MQPEFPITVVFHEDNTKWVLSNEEELANNLEWFDSTDPEYNADVWDAQNRKVLLKVEQLEVLELALA